MNRMVKKIMVVMLAVIMFFGMALTPVQAKPGRGSKPTPPPTTQEPSPEPPVNGEPGEEIETEEAVEEIEETPTEEAPAEEAPAEEVPVEKALAEESPTEEVPVEEALTEEAPAEGFAVNSADPAPQVRVLAEEPPVRSVGDTPDHSKTLIDNQDGTYTIALNVTGEAEKKTERVNVIVIIDRSGSMDEDGASEITYTPDDGTGSDRYGTFKENPDLHSDDDFFELTRRGYNNAYVYTYPSNGSTAYVPTNGNNGTQYGLVNGAYVQLTRRGGGTYFNPYYWTYGNNNTQYNGVRYTLVNNVALYTGQRYTRDDTISRLESTQRAVNSLAESLLSKNGQDGSPGDVVEMAMVSFANNASDNQYNLLTPTTSYSTFSNAVNGLDADGGTNWESGLKQALNINFEDEDQTFAIFFSDGSPTFYSTDAGNGDWNGTYGAYGSGREQEPNMGRSYTAATDDAAALATKVKPTNFYTIFAYGTTVGATYMSNLTTAAGAPSSNNYSVASTSGLQDAFDEILDKIEMAGFGDVEIDDGTTNKVSTSSGTVVELLEVDEDSYKYWRAGGDYGDVVGDDDFGTEWTGDDVPEAELVDGEVRWDLSSVGVLENGVTYTITFEVYPSQYTLDLIADLKNGTIEYSDVDPNIRQYLSMVGDDYKLATNTVATLTYDDTRDEEGPQYDTYDNPDPEPVTAAKELAISKVWSNTLDGRDNWKEATIELKVNRDDEEKYTVVLNDGNDWAEEVYISYGIMTVDGSGTISLKTTGHDFSFAEIGQESYNWEIEAPIVRPMLINKAQTMLVKIDDTDAPAALISADGENATITEAGVTYYKLTINGKFEYYKVDNAIASLTATNHRRSYLDVVKEVVGNIPADTEFEFKMTVKTNAENADPEDTDSDAWVWFSIYDLGSGTAVKDENAASGTDLQKQYEGGAFDGYFYIPSGNEITVKMKNNYSLRFLNLPVGTEYTVTETTSSSSKLVSIEGTRGFDADQNADTKDDWTTEAAGTVTNNTISGSIDYTESAYKVTVTNMAEAFYVYHSSNNEVEKIEFNDSRIDPEEFTFNIVEETLNGYIYGGYYTGYSNTSSEDADIIAAEYTVSPDKNIALTYTTARKGGSWYKDPSGTAYKGDLTTWNMEDAYTASGKVMKPEANKVYYLKEVPDVYLLPASYVVYDTRDKDANGAMQVKKLYLMTATDDGNYINVGFDLTATSSLGMSGAKTVEEGWWAEQIEVQKLGETYEMLTAASLPNIKAGLIAGYNINGAIVKNAYYREIPYHITPDHIKVTSLTQIMVYLKNTRFNNWDKTVGMYKTAMSKKAAYETVE